MARKDTTIVLKFGGSSVADAKCIERISKIALKEAQEHNVIVVTSAMGKSTNQLIDLANQACPGCSGRELDMLLATGELVSISLTAMTIQRLGHPAVSLTGWQAGFVTESSHNRARIAEIKCDRINKHLDLGEIVIVAGFQGITEDGEVTTLGRGGSDTSAVALAAAFEADRCDIYTDVDGVFTTDPRLVKEATMLSHISYEEMIELASLGAKVLHPRSVELAKKYNIDLRVRNSFNSANEGTRVISFKRMLDMELTKAVTGVALDTKQAKIAIINVADRPGIASRVFGELGKNKINVDMIIQSVPRDGVNDIAFTVPREDMELAKRTCEDILKDIEGSRVEADGSIAKVSIVGAGMLNRPGIASNLFETLSQAGINIQMISTSEIKISCLIDEANAEKAVQAIHAAFELEKSNEPIIV
ncbi:MAG: aspartate kinase [Cyanobacteria bacterium]|nr:aspartate kinase [Cyanobacteriota bacterium]MDA1020753.1 aspartate kinase [Cyanobacteriota bacterium]